MSRLLNAAGTAPFVFVVGKGGTGKTTTAGALALELADSGIETHLISTDPAHSLADLFQHAVDGTVAISQCSPLLRVEEFDAGGAAETWIARALGPVTALVEGGTYLDGEDVAAFSRLALPGIDEMMAVLRLASLADAGDDQVRIVVDTAPTGHTLRLLDAADIHEGIARALRAMADKAAAVAGAMTGRTVRMSGESVIEELERTVVTYREKVLAAAAFVVVSRPGGVVEAETIRLKAALETRSLHVAASVSTGVVEPGAAAADLPAAAGQVVELEVPVLADVAGCENLRRWRDHVRPGRIQTSGPGPEAAAPGQPGPAAAWLAGNARRLLLFAGKGGVGKSTCAAAAAVALADTRAVLLCSTDPAGSLGDVLGTASDSPAPRLTVRQVDAAGQLTRLRRSWEDEIATALERVGLSRAAALDRRVIETLWDLSPPGLDELAGVAAILAEAHSDRTIVIDSSPTGHFLRLLDMPDVALGWIRQLMRLFVKYGISGVAGGAAESLITLSRELRGLGDTLRDPASASVIIVTLDEPMVRAETQRLAASLERAGVSMAAVLLNRASDVPEAGFTAAARIGAPALGAGPVGVRALRGFVDTWKIVE